MQIGSRQRGVSLIEVMVAVLVFSLGLIGMAGLLVMATRSNHAAYLRTQASFLAHSMADRMRANPIGVWRGYYNNTKYPVSASQSCDAGCTPQQLAIHDQGMWSSQLTTFLPNVAASIACDNSGAAYAPTADQTAMRPPYGGNCTMSIQWSEQSVVASNGNTVPSFKWEFQP